MQVLGVRRPNRSAGTMRYPVQRCPECRRSFRTHGHSIDCSYGESAVATGIGQSPLASPSLPGGCQAPAPETLNRSFPAVGRCRRTGLAALLMLPLQVVVLFLVTYDRWADAALLSQVALYVTWLALAWDRADAGHAGNGRGSPDVAPRRTED